eukprot:562938-Amphidinium_carterae.1
MFAHRDPKRPSRASEALALCKSFCPVVSGTQLAINGNTTSRTKRRLSKTCCSVALTWLSSFVSSNLGCTPDSLGQASDKGMYPFGPATMQGKNPGKYSNVLFTPNVCLARGPQVHTYHFRDRATRDANTTRTQSAQIGPTLRSRSHLWCAASSSNFLQQRLLPH